MAQPRADYFHEVRQRLRSLARSRRSAVKVKMHGVERSVLEAVFARGDRRLAPVIERAYRTGARFDGWDETFDARLWDAAFEAEGLDPAWYAHRERPRAEVLPWDHLSGSAGREYLRRQYDDVFVKIADAGRIVLPVSAS
jgi:hypothetical protein